MIITDTLSHMPFQSGGTLFFCKSTGITSFTVKQTEVAKRLGIPLQTVEYHPWSLAKLEGDVESNVTVKGLVADSPINVFCNPVVDVDTISFIYGRTLYVADLLVDGELSPIKVRDNIFTGFVGRGQTVVSKHSCEGGEASEGDFVISSSLGVTEYETEFDSILRIIPHGLSSLIITGKKGGRTYSILWHSAENFFTLQANGHDVYKCCLDGTDIIHTVKGPGIQDRHLHRDTVEMIHE